MRDERQACRAQNGPPPSKEDGELVEVGALVLDRHSPAPSSASPAAKARRREPQRLVRRPSHAQSLGGQNLFVPKHQNNLPTSRVSQQSRDADPGAQKCRASEYHLLLTERAIHGEQSTAHRPSDHGRRTFTKTTTHPSPRPPRDMQTCRRPPNAAHAARFGSPRHAVPDPPHP